MDGSFYAVYTELTDHYSFDIADDHGSSQKGISFFAFTIDKTFANSADRVAELIEKNKKIAAAAYEYKAVHRYANDDDEWGEIRFDFSAGTAQIVKLADGDLSRSKVFAIIAIRQIMKLSMSELPKKLTIPFELDMEKIRFGS